LGLPVELASASIRIGLGRFTTDEDIETAIEQIGAAVQQLRAAGPQAAE